MKTEKTGKENTKHAANLAGTQQKYLCLIWSLFFVEWDTEAKIKNPERKHTKKT